MTIIVSKFGSNAKIVKPVGFDAENSLQAYIHQNPESIPIHELREDKKLLILKKEFPTNSGPIDALAIDKDGEVYIIETKLYKNPDKRRVIAQVLDYGAALWANQLDPISFMEIVDKEIQYTFGLTFEEKLKEFFDLNDQMIDDLKTTIHNNLKDGSLRFIILMDQIDHRLKDLIVYVNQNSKFDVYGVQFKYYQVENYEIVIPKIFGAEVKKNLPSSPAKIEWNEDMFLKEMSAKAGGNASKIATSVLGWCDSKNLKIVWGTGLKIGTFYPTLKIGEKEIKLFCVNTNGHLEIIFKNYPLELEKRIEMIQALNAIEVISLEERKAKSWSSFSLLEIEDKTNFDAFFRIYDEWVIKIAENH